MTRRFILYLVLFLILLFNLAACASGPKLIASHPTNIIGGSSAKDITHYSEKLEMEVWDVQAAADESVRLVYNHGGYLDDIHKTDWMGNGYARLEIQVPNTGFQPLYEDLCRLGKVIDSSIISSNIRSKLNLYPSEISHITLELRLRKFPYHEVEQPGWSPLRTLRKALGVSFGIFSVVVDLAIWVIVVAGPFVLIGWVIYLVIKRWKR